MGKGMKIKIAIAHIADSRDDFYEKRKPLVEDEITGLSWLREQGEICESGILRSDQAIADYVREAKSFNAQSLVIHVPIWSDPLLAVKICNQLRLPVLLLGNSRPDTSSFVGMLGGGGALDQVGVGHERVFDGHEAADRKAVLSFIKAVAVIDQLNGLTLGRFGGKSLGIVTADIDPNQWQRVFGINVENLDEHSIVEAAEKVGDQEVAAYIDWLKQKIDQIEFNGLFNEAALEKQVRSYLATKKLTDKHGLDFVAVKCQPELSDGYVSQCLAHMLMNGTADLNGPKKSTAYACESDADGALTMQIMSLLSGSPSSLLDIRWYDKKAKLWTFANCGAIPADFFATAEDATGLSQVKMVPHVFGAGGGSALTGVVGPQEITIARLCRNNDKYWMAIVAGEVKKVSDEELAKTTYAFPKAFVKAPTDDDFLSRFGSNHVHMVSGDIVDELIMFCKLKGIEYKVWR